MANSGRDGAKVEGFSAKAIILASRNSSKVNFGRWQKVRKTYENVSNLFKINLQKLLRASSPHSKSCFRKLAASQKEKPKKKLEKVTEKVGKGSHRNFQKQPFEPSGYL